MNWKKLPLSKDRSIIRWRIYYGGMVFLGGVAVMTVVLGGMYWMRAGKRPPKTEQRQPVEAVIPAQASSLPTIDRSTIGVSVYNASGRGGEAKKLLEKITALGYRSGILDKTDIRDVSQLLVSPDLASMAAIIADDLGTVMVRKIPVDSGEKLATQKAVVIYLGKDGL